MVVYPGRNGTFGGMVEGEGREDEVGDFKNEF
jgi:hypothetical protein